MIKTALVAMTVMGCDCDAKVCEYIGETAAQWATVGECEAAMTAQVTRRRDLDYPLISGICRAVPGAAPEMVAAASPTSGAPTVSNQPAVSNDIVGAIPRETVPPAARTANGASKGAALYDIALGSGRVVYRKTADGYDLAREGVGIAASSAVSLVKWTATSLIPGY